MRRYLNWAAPHYEKFSPERREEVVELDRWLYSRRSFGFLIGMVGAAAGIFLGLKATGLRTGLAVVVTIVIFMVAFFTIVQTWWSGEILTDRRPAFLRKNPWLSSLWTLCLAFWGGLVGFTISAANSWADLLNSDFLVKNLHEAFITLFPSSIAILFVALGMVGVTLVLKKQQLQNRVIRLQEQTAKQHTEKLLAEAKLRVLQAQIKPHFLFNTLAALQYWTDTNDPKASRLLKSLTGFLRISANSMDRYLIPLEQEIELTKEYLKIMQFRLGEKLTFNLEIASTAQLVEIPPALLLTLVENAVEHGIEPSLSGGKIEVSASVDNQQLKLIVLNSGVKLDAQHLEGVGLNNSRERIKAHYGEHGDLELSLHPISGHTIAQFTCPIDSINLAKN